MPFAFAPYHYIWLAILSFSGLTWLIQSKYPFLTGYSFGFGWFGLGAWWLAPTVHTYGGLPWALAIIVPILIGLVMGLFPAIWTWACVKVCRFNGKPYALLLLLPCSAILMEWLRGHVFTGLPWTSMGNLLLDSPASAWLSIFGVNGMAFLPVLLGVSLTLLWQKKQREYAIISIVLCAIFIYFTPTIPQTESPELQVALIQPNIPQDQKWDSRFLNQSMQSLAQLSEKEAANVDLIIWPEAAVPFYIERSPNWSRWLQEQMSIWKTPVLFGSLKLFLDTGASQNGLYLLEPHNTTNEKQFVGKHHLVPFGEYIPSWLPWLRKIGPDIADFQPARDNGILSNKSTLFGSLICYESIFPEEARQRVQAGANVLIVVTNDAWYGHSPAAWQHFQASQARAIETGRYVLRVGNTGVSAIIAPDGRITNTAPWWTASTIVGTYRTSNTITPYQTWGNIPAFTLFGILLTGLLFFRKRREHI
ncbi:MAG: apolipoprotein N-acyltransferase [Mariprofundaceae bacterium]|nr:apolipoprotein N-acyltransferase [Mariprofundaceae bacterium]